ncbi:hypothetical protein AMTR_s00074p00185070 [Amborella trichopoda]|uniref:Uncharacterized protein n=1 Tax=Amborella trichopoda TaxID=13333 RepID=W1NN09_AMBTC|nr:hypothetical protein AMTR_s00074p00185070 [Amborella trichopoda]
MSWSVDSWPRWSSVLPLDPGRSSRSPTSRVEVGMTSATSACMASPSRPATSVPLALKAAQKKMGASTVRLPYSSVAQSSGLHASEGMWQALLLGLVMLQGL